MVMTTASHQLELSSRPFQTKTERIMSASAHVLYLAWTEDIDQWFANPGSVTMKPEINTPFYFEVSHQDQTYPHSGRFLTLEQDRLIEMVWKSPATNGETIVRVELTPVELGTRLKLTHSGFTDEASWKQHEEAWPHVLTQLDERTAPV